MNHFTVFFNLLYLDRLVQRVLELLKFLSPIDQSFLTYLLRYILYTCSPTLEKEDTGSRNTQYLSGASIATIYKLLKKFVFIYFYHSIKVLTIFIHLSINIHTHLRTTYFVFLNQTCQNKENPFHLQKRVGTKHPEIIL